MGVFDRIGERVAELLGDSLVDVPSQGRSEINALSTLLPWRTYDTATDLYVLDGGYGIALEVHPVSGGGDVGRRIQSLINQYFPPNGVVQFINWASPQISGDLHQWWRPRMAMGGVAARMSRERVAFFEEGRFSSVVRPIVLPHRRRLIITARIDGDAVTPRGLESLTKFRSAVESAFRDIGTAWLLQPEDFLAFTSELLHVRRPSGGKTHAYNREEPLNTQFGGATLMTSDHGVHLSGVPDISVACGAVKFLPEQFSFAQGPALNGIPDNPEMRPVGPVLTTMTVTAQSGDKAKAAALKKVGTLDHMIKTGMAKFSRGASEQRDEWARVADDVSKSQRLLNFSIFVCAYAADAEATPADAIDEMRKIWRAQNIELGDETGVHQALFLNSLPLVQSRASMRDFQSMMRVRVGLSETAAFLAPVHGEWVGHRDPNGVLLFGRAGQMFTWNPFRSSTNFNVAVSGRSGSGKSVFMQEMATSLVCSGGRAIVVDDGRSFLNTARALGGDFVTFEEDAKRSLNPFSMISSSAMDVEADGEDGVDYRSIALGAATSIAVTIATWGSTSIDRFEREMIGSAVEAAWDAKGANACFTDVRDALVRMGETDARAKDLAQMFRRFSRGGEYAHWFEGRSDLRIDNAFTVFELGDIKSNKLLKSIVLQIIMFLGEQLMFSTDRSVRVGLIIDEAWDLLDGEEMGEFIGGIARRARKHSGMLVTGTQSINDFYANPAARATVDNSDWMVVLSQKGEAIDNLRTDNRLSVSEHIRSQLATLQKRDGAFSEMAIRNSDGQWVFGRLVLDPYSIGVYSSKGETVERVKNLQAQGLSMEDAIAVVVAEGGT